METPILDIWSPDPGDNYALTQDLAAMADSIEEGVLANKDIVRVASVSARTALVNQRISEGRPPTASEPLFVYRSDAPGLHRLEYTVDGVAWVPASGLPRFATRTEANNWASVNGSLLTAGDQAVVAGTGARWSGTEWHVDGDSATPTIGSGWRDVAMNVVTRYGGQAEFSFNAFRATAAAVGAPIATIPAGYRGGANIFGAAWGLAGANNFVQIRYNPAASHVVYLNQGVAEDHAIALTLRWSIRS